MDIKFPVGTYSNKFKELSVGIFYTKLKFTSKHLISIFKTGSFMLLIYFMFLIYFERMGLFWNFSQMSEEIKCGIFLE